MSRTKRLYKIDQLLNDRKVFPCQALLDALELALATLKRDPHPGLPPGRGKE